MPIDYKKYPANWKSEIRPDILKRANNCCEFCGIENKVVFINDREILQSYENSNFYICPDGYKRLLGKTGSWHLKQIVLTIAHLDHDITNNDYLNLRALCQRCHNRHDVGFRKQNRDKNKLKLF